MTQQEIQSARDNADSARLGRLVLVAFLLAFMTARVIVFLIMTHRLPDLYLYVGGSAEDSGTTGRGSANKTPVAVAVELTDGRPRRVALRRLERVDGHCLRRFARAAIRRGSTLRTDGWGS